MLAKEKLEELYLKRLLPLPEIARRFDRSVGSLWYLFKKLGIPTRGQKASNAVRPRAVTSEEKERMKQLYESGLSASEVGIRLGRNPSLVLTHLRRLGVTRPHLLSVELATTKGKNRHHTLNERFFETWSTPMAWVLGLIFGDGNVHIRKGEQYSITLCGSQQIVKASRSLVGSDAPIRQCRNRGNPVRCWVVTWYSKKMIESLRQYGLTGGSKAKTLELPPQVPNESEPSFFRGLWDSDGHWNRRGGCLNAEYVSASPRLVRGIRSRLEARGIGGGRIYKHKRQLKKKWFTAWSLWLPANSSRKLAAWLYSDSTDETRCPDKFKVAVLR